MTQNVTQFNTTQRKSNMDFYNTHHKDFSNTRHSVWKSVKDFCDSIHTCGDIKSTILDAGCGNGKNIIYMKNRFPMSNIVGFDTCVHFVDECKKKIKRTR